MNRRFFVHSVDVKRQKSTKTGRKKDRGFDTVFTAMACLMEPDGAEASANAFGHVTHKDWKMSFGTEAIAVGDRVVWNAEEYRVDKLVNDQFRPFSSVAAYQVAELRKVLTA